MREPLLAIIDGSNTWYRSFWIRPFGVNALARMSYRKALNDVYATHAVMVFDSKAGDLFRKSKVPTYKANRRIKPKIEIEQMRAFRKMVDTPVVMVHGRDGDDVMYALAMRATIPCVIISADKDMLQCVNEKRGISVYDPMKGETYKTARDIERRRIGGKGGTDGIRPENVAAYLALVGDEVDNVDGLKGIGPKTAREIIDSGDIEGHPRVKAHRKLYRELLWLTTLHPVALTMPSLEAMALRDVMSNRRGTVPRRAAS